MEILRVLMWWWSSAITVAMGLELVVELLPMLRQALATVLVLAATGTIRFVIMKSVGDNEVC